MCKTAPKDREKVCSLIRGPWCAEVTYSWPKELSLNAQTRCAQSDHHSQQHLSPQNWKPSSGLEACAQFPK